MPRCRTRMFLLFMAVLFVAVVPSVAQITAPSSVPPYLNSSLPINARVDDLVARMTLEEKASQLVNQARAIPRLQVPAYDWWSEALHGVANAGTATVFPEPIGLAATFDAPLIHEMAVVISTEARAKHNQAVRAGHRDIMEGLDFWSPNINILRDPRWGRGQETYGEDPFLTGRMGVAFVTGMQGEDPKYFRVISTPKHFAVHSGPEPSRHMIDVKVSKHDEEDTYLPAFRAAITEGKAESIMCAYNRINGEPACANTFLLKDQLRGAWKFNGYVVSDCDAITDIFNGHLSVNWANEHADAILDAWYSGEEGGTAVAQTLAGVNNPAGRLPVTFYKGVDQLPAFEDYSMKNRTYRYFEGQPLYAFGYGLSYSKFEYSNLKLSSARLKAGDSLSVDADVRNTSQTEGDEVVELYLSFPRSPVAPLRALCGFTRIHVGAGDTQRVHFMLDARDLNEVDNKGDRIIASGAYRITVGGGQPGTAAPQAEAGFKIKGKRALPE